MKKIILLFLVVIGSYAVAMEKTEDLTVYDESEQRIDHPKLIKRKKDSAARTLFPVAPSITKKRSKALKESRKSRNARFEANKENIIAILPLNFPRLDKKILAEQLEQELAFGEEHTSDDPMVVDESTEIPAPRPPSFLVRQKAALDRAAQRLLQ